MYPYLYTQDFLPIETATIQTMIKFVAKKTKRVSNAPNSR